MNVPALASSILDLDAIRAAPLTQAPYRYVLGRQVIRSEAVPALLRDFPAIEKPGYLTLDEVGLAGRFGDLVAELESDAVSRVLGETFGIDLVSCPRLTTVMRRSQSKYGAIHTDGAAKVMTLLLYMNEAWETAEAGRLRVLYDGERFDPYAVEVPPTMGTMFAFLRADNSWHGHRPFAGERRVVQVAWMRDAAELARKRRRNRTSQLLKGIFRR
ncbi:2OG-Fe(II) oxygenase [Methylobacterium indicum]|uniref:Prolyl 4-hydroxylase alpha subunit Fe(2+) 2OG dioxygenase domain-containing protein n=1 Tax=Methylobacterium indicum TaxID=1775910 RepID=A0A8H9C8F8_9HYPH|nr:2OG-Fe(II) oxygenase [Methylobacterium indicum]BCM85851.1 hypothetical protein mvi_43120 [Methylobacterium indicum]